MHIEIEKIVVDVTHTDFSNTDENLNVFDFQNGIEKVEIDG